MLTNKIARGLGRCDYATWLKIARPDEAGTAKRADWLDMVVAEQSEAMPAAIATLVGRPGVVVINTPEGGNPVENAQAQTTATLAALATPGVTWVLGGRLPDIEGKQCVPDGLVVASRRRDSGAAARVLPVAIRAAAALTGTSRTTVSMSNPKSPLRRAKASGPLGSSRPDDLFELASVWSHLTKLGLTRGGRPSGAVWGREGMLVWFALNKATVTDPTDVLCKVDALTGYTRGMARREQVITAARMGDASVVSPLRTAECATCPFWDTVCRDELRDSGHISMLAGVTASHVALHAQAGTTTVLDLARLDLATANAIAAGDREHEGGDAATWAYADLPAKVGVWLPQHILTARTARRGKVTVRNPLDELQLPRADVEIDFDLENSPTGQVYLWGVLDTARWRKGNAWKSKSIRRTFADFTVGTLNEGAIFAEFWEFLMNSKQRAIESGRTWRAYHYAHHEATMAKKLAARYVGHPGVPTVEEVEAFFTSDDVVDMYKLVKQFYWPTPTLGLKDTAGWARFVWSTPDANGATSMAWYMGATGQGAQLDHLTVEGETPALLQAKLLDYVLDDCGAQVAVRDFLEDVRDNGSLIPAAALRPPRRAANPTP